MQNTLPQGVQSNQGITPFTLPRTLNQRIPGCMLCNKSPEKINMSSPTPDTYKPMFKIPHLPSPPLDWIQIYRCSLVGLVNIQQRQKIVPTGLFCKDSDILNASYWRILKKPNHFCNALAQRIMSKCPFAIVQVSIECIWKGKTRPLLSRISDADLDFMNNVSSLHFQIGILSPDPSLTLSSMGTQGLGECKEQVITLDYSFSIVVGLDKVTDQQPRLIWSPSCQEQLIYELPSKKKAYLLNEDPNEPWGDQVNLYWAVFGYVVKVNEQYFSREFREGQGQEKAQVVVRVWKTQREACQHWIESIMVNFRDEPIYIANAIGWMGINQPQNSAIMKQEQEEIRSPQMIRNPLVTPSQPLTSSSIREQRQEDPDPIEVDGDMLSSSIINSLFPEPNPLSSSPLSDPLNYEGIMVPQINYEEITIQIFELRKEVKKENPDLDKEGIDEIMRTLLYMTNSFCGFWKRFNDIMTSYAHLSLTGSIEKYNECSFVPGSWDRSHMFLLSGPPGMGKSLLFRTLEQLSAQNPQFPNSFLYAMQESNKGLSDTNNVLVDRLRAQQARSTAPKVPLEQTKKLVLWCNEEFSSYSPHFLEDIDLLKSLLDRLTNSIPLQMKYAPEINIPMPLYFINTNEQVPDFLNLLMEKHHFSAMSERITYLSFDQSITPVHEAFDKYSAEMGEIIRMKLRFLNPNVQLVRFNTTPQGIQRTVIKQMYPGELVGYKQEDGPHAYFCKCLEFIMVEGGENWYNQQFETLKICDQMRKLNRGDVIDNCPYSTLTHQNREVQYQYKALIWSRLWYQQLQMFYSYQNEHVGTLEGYKESRIYMACIFQPQDESGEYEIYSLCKYQMTRVFLIKFEVTKYFLELNKWDKFNEFKDLMNRMVSFHCNELSLSDLIILILESGGQWGQLILQLYALFNSLYSVPREFADRVGSGVELNKQYLQIQSFPHLCSQALLSLKSLKKSKKSTLNRILVLQRPSLPPMISINIGNDRNCHEFNFCSKLDLNQAPQMDELDTSLKVGDYLWIRDKVMNQFQDDYLHELKSIYPQ